MKNKNLRKKEIKFFKKHLYTLITLMILSVGILYVAAAPPGTQPNPGHLGSAIAPGSIATAQIGDGAVTADELASDAVTSIKIADGAVTADKLASNALSLAKVSGGLLTILSTTLNVGGKIQATDDVCTDLAGGVCLSTVSGGGGADSDWTIAGNDMYSAVLGNVGIGTTSPSKKLDVDGDVRVRNLASCDTIDTDALGNLACGTDEAGSGGTTIPSGAVMTFDLSSCPAGWSELVSARGRYIVGMDSGQTPGTTIGTALQPLENRAVGQHNHGVNDPGHKHTNSGSLIGGFSGGTTLFARPGSVIDPYTIHSSTTRISIDNAGSVAGTPAPYIQLLICKKN